MPEKDPALWHWLADWANQLAQAAILAAVGVMIGIGQLLLSQEILTWRVIIGRAMSTAGLGMAAAVVLLLFPGVSLLAMVGLSAAIASLGTSALERVLQRFIGGGQ